LADRLAGGLVVCALALAPAAQSHAFKEESRSCAACHTLSETEATAILEKLNIPAAKVFSIEMSPIKGLWEVAVQKQGRSFVIYVDFSKKLITSGPFIDYASRKDITREKNDALNKGRAVSVEGLSLQDAFTIGKPDAPARVIVFTDPGCPYCAKLHGEMKTVSARRPDIVFYLKVFALVSRDPKIAKSIVCSGSLVMLEDAYDKKPVPELDCPSKAIDDSMTFVRQHGIDAAPALIFPDGSLQLGWLDAASLETKIDEAMKNRKKETPGDAARDHAPP
jgi:thiol:disulfide interchange protein DsbC